MSAGPPAGKGTIMRTGFEGYGCASPNSGKNNKSSNQRFKVSS
jgi:hypothetical protein